MPRSGLDRGRIVAVALDVLDEVGLDGLSTRALADRIGVQSPALYWHFRNKQELVSAMAEAMVLQLSTSPPDLGRHPTRKAVAAWMIVRGGDFRRALLSRRDGARVHAGSRPPESRLPQVEAQIAMLGRLGFDPVSAARVTIAISRFVLGWVLEEQNEQPTPDLPSDSTSYPLVTEVLQTMRWHPAEPDFNICLTAVVDGLLRTPTKH